MSIKKRSSSQETREKILDTADKLFYQHGIKSVGVDTIIAESGVAKMSLYKHFSSKENLILEYLNRRDKCFSETFSKYMDDTESENPVLDYFQNFIKFIESEEEVNCCPFINVSAEINDLNNPVHISIAEHKNKTKNKLEECLIRMGLDNIEEKSDHILLLWHGLTMNKKIFGKSYNTKYFISFIKQITSK